MPGYGSPASAIGLTPRKLYGASCSTAAVKVSGTFTPVVGNFAVDRADDVFWYGPGKATDAFWANEGLGGLRGGWHHRCREKDAWPAVAA